jgi:predicted MFS family arabinose efflux permease
LQAQCALFRGVRVTRTNSSLVRGHGWVRIFLPFALGYYLSYLLRTVNAVISPLITDELGLSAASLGLMTSAYFVAFGVAQIPVGIALDRYGPRRVEAALLLLAALGSALFACGDSLGELAAARALVGLGVSACLMAALKGFAMWYPPERQSSLIGFIMASGSLGALTASVPLEIVLPALGWRGAFWIIAAVALLAAVLVLRALPESRQETHERSLGQALKVVAAIYASPVFLRYAPVSVFFVGGFMALQSLWVVPWVMNVNGLDLSGAAKVLVALNLGNLAGQLSIGLLGVRLARAHVQPLGLLRVGYAGMLVVQALILWSTLPPLLLWSVFGVLTAVNSQTYLAASRAFPVALFGRVSTALNLMAFAGAFIVQWGMGIGLDAMQAAGADLRNALAYGFAGLLVLQAAAFVPLLGRADVRPGQGTS